MSKENVNYHKLMQWHREIQSLKMNDHIFGRFLKIKIDEFYNNNRIRINSFIDKVKELDKEWIEFDGDKMVFEGEGKEKKKKLLEGLKSEDYEAASKALWDMVTVVEI